jgi:hypothetical protein
MRYCKTRIGSAVKDPKYFTVRPEKTNSNSNKYELLMISIIMYRFYVFFIVLIRFVGRNHVFIIKMFLTLRN